jgi:hypothetical protein
MIIEKGPDARTVNPVFDGRDDLIVIPDAQPDVDFGKTFFQGRFFFFHVTPGDDDTGGSPPGLGRDHFPDTLVGFVPGRPDEAAGVENDDVGLGGVRDDFIPGYEKMAGHHFTVDQVFRTAEINDGRAAGFFQG